jgi:hypothetical protein
VGKFPVTQDKFGVLNVVVPVWGDAYLQKFLEYSLPAQLAAGNIPVLAGDPRAPLHGLHYG